MGCCCCKKKDPEAFELHQIEKLRAKVQAYVGDEKINRYNIVRNIAFGMQEIAKKKLAGESKKKIVADIIIEFLDVNAFPPEIVRMMVENIIDDLYTSFRKLFRRSCC